MNHFCTLSILKKSKLLCSSLALSLTLSVSAQTTENSKENSSNFEFELPKDNHFGNNFKPNSTQFKSGSRKFFRLGDFLASRAVLPAASFSEGPTSGLYINSDTINQQPLPFIEKQPIQGFSSVLNNFDRTFTVLSDNGFGSIENSADYNLRLYHIKPNFENVSGLGDGTIEVLGFTELQDPNKLIPFAITNQFSTNRILTGADFDIESIQRDRRTGDYWIGEEFGPFILHFDKNGILLDTPIALPDFDTPGKELRSPQNPYNEESSAIRIMNAMRAHAMANGSEKMPVMSPWFVMLDDGETSTLVGSRENPPAEMQKASSELFNVSSLNGAGHPVVVYTVNDTENMSRLLEDGLQGIISDRPDLLLEAVKNFDQNNDGQPDYMDTEGLIDVNLFDAQGHRGARNLRPENTLPSMEAALDYLMPTLETDCGITLDGIPLLDHDPHIEAAKTRKADGAAYEFDDEVLVKDFTLNEIQSTFIADKILDGRPVQTNDLALSPVSVAFANQNGFINPYIMPSLQQLFDFVDFYVEYYKNGLGATMPDAAKRWKNASKVRFNIETKINPRTDTDDRGDVFAERTIEAEPFAKAIADIIVSNDLTDRADIQSFDFRTLLVVQKQYPEIRTVCLFGDFPKVGDAGDGTNLQDQNGANTPWLAGMYWPYRNTVLDNSFRVPRSGGFEGMAITTDGKKLLTLLEKPIIGDEGRNLLIHEFDLNSKSYNGKKYKYPLNERGTAIGDFVMFNRKRGLIIERDGSQGDLNGFKAIYEIELDQNNEMVRKELNLDLLNINDYFRISEPGLSGDVGIGQDFAFPFVTIESVVVFNPFLVGVLNDNNYPFSVGRHVGSGLPDDNEFILVWLDQPLGRFGRTNKDTLSTTKMDVDVFPNTFTERVVFSKDFEGESTASVTIYDLTGKLVKKVAQDQNTTGNIEFVWDAKSDQGDTVTPGIYIAIIDINGELIKKKLVKN